MNECFFSTTHTTPLGLALVGRPYASIHQSEPEVDVLEDNTLALWVDSVVPVAVVVLHVPTDRPTDRPSSEYRLVQAALRAWLLLQSKLATAADGDRSRRELTLEESQLDPS